MQLFLEMLSNVFVTVLNMSITASVIIAFVFIARLCLKGAPRGFSYALWAVVLFRLLCPISFELPIAALSLTGASPTAQTKASTMQYIQPDWALQQDSTDTTVDASDGVGGVPNEGTAAITQDMAIASNSAQGISFHIVTAASVIWLLGAAGLFGANCFSLLRLKKKLRPALRYGGETYAALAETPIYQSDAIPTAFVLGGLKPCIFLPMHLSMQEQSYILRHEQVHIARRDHLWQALAFLALCLHWFHPLVWFAFKANQKDMELSCDERVLRQMGNGIKKEYAQSLLNLSQGQTPAIYSVLAFGENDATSRIKNVLSYRKPVLWVSLFASVALIAAVVLLVANPITEIDAKATADDIASQALVQDGGLGVASSAMPTTTPMPTLDPLAVAGIYADQDISFAYPTDWQVVGDIDAALKIYPSDAPAYSFTIEKGSDAAILLSDLDKLTRTAISESDTTTRVIMFVDVDGYDAFVSEVMLDFSRHGHTKRTQYQLIVDDTSYTITLDCWAIGYESETEDVAIEKALFDMVGSIVFTAVAPIKDVPSLKEMQEYALNYTGSFQYPACWDILITQYDDFQTQTFFDQNASLEFTYGVSYLVSWMENEEDIQNHLDSVGVTPVGDVSLVETDFQGDAGQTLSYQYELNGQMYTARRVIALLGENQELSISFYYRYLSEKEAEYAAVLDIMMESVELP